MKLRTHLSAATSKWLPAMTWSDGLGEGLNHDAAAAHALMQAINAWAARRADHASYADHLTGHADQIMANWGFDSGEVE